MADSKLMKYGASLNEAPKNKDINSSQYLKLAQRVEHSLKSFCENAVPKQIPPQKLIPAPFNRDGSAPNVMHIHKGILGSIKKMGFARDRPQPGICIEFKSPEGKAALLAHYRRFSKGNPLLPQVNEKEALYGTLASSHFNLALQALKVGIQGPQGDMTTCVQESPALRDFVENGHHWWVLKETTPKEAQLEISTWRNQDQNENQQTHEVELLQTIKSTAEDLYRGGTRKINLAELTAMADKRNPTKTSPTMLQALSKYYIGFLENKQTHLVGELQDFHSTSVDPKELVVSAHFFQGLNTGETLQKVPLTRHYLLLTQYTTEKCRPGLGGATAGFLEPSVIANFVKKPDQVAELEKLFEDLRQKHLPILAETLGERQARQEFSVYADLIVRCVLAKPYPDLGLKCPVSTGKFCAEKAKHLEVFWGKCLDRKYPIEKYSSKLGLEEEATLASSGGVVDEEVDLEPPRKLMRTSSAASGTSEADLKDLATTLTRGDKVVVNTRTAKQN